MAISTNAQQQLATMEQDLTALYTRYERELQAWIASYERGVSCCKGCCECCNVSVGLYLPEVLVLANSLSDKQYARVFEHAQRVLAYANDTPNYLEGFRYSEIGWCPFLDTESGACTIHPYRPASCRYLYSNMPPAYCVTGIEKQLDRHPEQYEKFLQQLDPDVNEEGLPYIEPLQDIFYGKYAFYLTALTAKYCNFTLYGEMSWLITLARDYDLWTMITAPDVTLADFQQNLRSTGWYHDNVLTECQQIPPDLKTDSADLDFS